MEHSEDAAVFAAAARQEPAKPITIGRIFLEFLLVGATSFGGGVVAYLQNAFVGKLRWLEDKQFVELLTISQSLPGLNATNLAVLIGDRLRGIPGALAAMVGMCLPGGVFMYTAAALYSSNVERPIAEAALKGVAAAAVGLILATTAQLARKSLAHRYDLVFVALAVLLINRLDQPVPTVLLGVGLLSVLLYRPGGRAAASKPEDEPKESVRE